VAGRAELADVLRPLTSSHRRRRLDEHGLLTTRPGFGRTLEAC
jgi:hypothetical protein